MTRTLVTGGTGFVGSRLARALLDDGHRVRLAVRRPATGLPVGAEAVEVGGIDGGTDWAAALDGVDHVVHAAARVHVMTDMAADPLAEHRRINAEGTGALAAAAAAAGVRRFVMLSSVKVMGELSGERAWTEAAPPAPVDPYGISKLEGEKRLAEAAAGRGMGYVILRPPLVYGPGVKGNFLSLLKLSALPLPLPLGGIANRRSLVFVGNLADGIRHALTCPACPDGAYFVGDGAPVSTAELVRRIRAAMGRRPNLVPVPAGWLDRACRLTGRGDLAARLAGNLAVDDRAFRQATGWQAPVGFEQGLAETVEWFRQQAT